MIDRGVLALSGLSRRLAAWRAWRYRRPLVLALSAAVIVLSGVYLAPRLLDALRSVGWRG